MAVFGKGLKAQGNSLSGEHIGRECVRTPQLVPSGASFHTSLHGSGLSSSAGQHSLYPFPTPCPVAPLPMPSFPGFPLKYTVHIQILVSWSASGPSNQDG